MADCGSLAININLDEFAYNPGGTFSPPYPDFNLDLLQYFSPFPKLPGGIDIPPFQSPSAVFTPDDIMSVLFDKLSPLFGALAVAFVIMKLISCIINIICAIPDPFRIIKAVLDLFLDCIPAILSFFPQFYMVLLIITIIRMLIALLLAIVECIISTIEGIIAVGDQIKIIKEEFNNSKGAGGAFAAFAKLICQLGLNLQTCFGSLNLLGPITAFIGPFLGLSFSTTVPDISFTGCFKDDDSSGTGECPPAEELQRFLDNPNDPAGFSFDPALVPVSCYPNVQSQVRLIQTRYDRDFEIMPEIEDSADLLDDLNNLWNQYISTDNCGPIDINDPNSFNCWLDKFDQYPDPDPFESRINQYIDGLKCTLYAAACNTLDYISTTFTANINSVPADGVTPITLTLTPRDIRGDAIGPIGIGPIPTPYEPSIATTLGTVTSIEEQEDGSFVAQIVSDEVGTADVCALIKCLLCDDDGGDDGGGGDIEIDGYSYNVFEVTTKTIDGIIRRRSVALTPVVAGFVGESTPLVGITEIPPLDGYGASSYELDETPKCLTLNFTPVPITAGTTVPGACE